MVGYWGFPVVVAGARVVDVCTVSDEDTQAGGAAAVDGVLDGHARLGPKGCLARLGSGAQVSGLSIDISASRPRWLNAAAGARCACGRGLLNRLRKSRRG